MCLMFYVHCNWICIWEKKNENKIANAISHSGRYVRFNGNRKMNQLRGHVDTFTSIIALRKDENNDENEIGWDIKRRMKWSRGNKNSMTNANMQTCMNLSGR